MSDRELLAEDPENAPELNNLETENIETIAAEAIGADGNNEWPHGNEAERSNEAPIEPDGHDESSSTLVHAPMDVPPGIPRSNHHNENELALTENPGNDNDVRHLHPPGVVRPNHHNDELALTVDPPTNIPHHQPTRTLRTNHHNEDELPLTAEPQPDVPRHNPIGILRPNHHNDELALTADPQPDYGSARRHASFATDPVYRRSGVPMRTHSDPSGRKPRELSLAMRIRTKDWNTYHQRKIYATGMMDVSLFTANANQLRYVIELGHSMDFYVLALTLLIFSITLQLIVGGLLISVTRYDVSKVDEEELSSHINDWMLLFVFLIIVVNVFISAFILDYPSLGFSSDTEFSEPL